MADVFTVLGQDHQEVKHMLAELEKGPTSATGASEDQLALRKKMTEELIIEEAKHEALEEMYFWPAVREYIQSGNILADEATRQEQDAKEVLADLDKLSPGDADFERLFCSFIVDARVHIEFEETEVWPLMGGESPRGRRPRPAGRTRTRRLPAPRRRLADGAGGSHFGRAKAALMREPVSRRVPAADAAAAGTRDCPGLAGVLGGRERGHGTHPGPFGN